MRASPRRLGPQAAQNWPRRWREGFIQKYLSGAAVLDIGYRGEFADAEPITDQAIGIDLDYPGYDGKTLPFAEASQDAVFASHVLEHIVDWADALADWYRVLKIGGFLIVAVPHRDLYERKSKLPSRFNDDHKRFYTPGSLLQEIETALPVGGYRIRSLRDIDDRFDYTIPPERHAAGSYEIELVVEKIVIPTYADLLRPRPEGVEVIARCADLVVGALGAARRGAADEVARLQEALRALPLPPFAELQGAIKKLLEPAERGADMTGELRPLLAPVVAKQTVLEDWYLQTYPDVAKAAAVDPNVTAYRHFVWHGYFEGRSPGIIDPIFR